jgi:RNA ligase (TIGR02306 family)
MRKLASIRRISEVRPISGADAIECCVIDGWTVVAKKGEFVANDFAVYCELDSFIPHDLAPFLSKGSEPKEFDGVKGNRLRSISLRGQLSQGLLLKPLQVTPAGRVMVQNSSGFVHTFQEGDDVSTWLNIKKWERPIPAALAGQVKGDFPAWIRKTDQERCQNLLHEIFVENVNSSYEVTMKLDGSSCTIYHKDGELGVCSRNLELKINDANKDNTLVRMLFETGLNESLVKLGKNIAIQGEIMGPGVQGNREKLTKHALYVYDIYDIDNQRYLTEKERDVIFTLYLLPMAPTLDGESALRHVPVLQYDNRLSELRINNIEELLKFAEGKSIKNEIREGVVFKRMDGKFSFKAISNLFLLKGGD